MKITEKQRDTAKKLFKKMPAQKELYINDKGEFFTEENLVKNSVKSSKGEFISLTREAAGIGVESKESNQEKKETSKTPEYPLAAVEKVVTQEKTPEDTTKTQVKEGKQESTKKEDSKDKTQGEPKQEKNQNKNK